MTTKQAYKTTYISLPVNTNSINKNSSASLSPSNSPSKKIKFTPQTKCSFCPGTICCTYFTEQVDTPRSKKDFDHLLWQLSHANTQLYKDEEGWFLLINNQCTHLQKNGQCGIYETRPQVCRDYSNDYCEYDEPATKHFKLFFAGYPELLKYCKKRFKKWGQEYTN